MFISHWCLELPGGIKLQLSNLVICLKMYPINFSFLFSSLCHFSSMMSCLVLAPSINYSWSFLTYSGLHSYKPTVNWNIMSKMLLIHLNCQETPGVTGKFGLGIRNEAGQRLIEFYQENALVITNIHHKPYLNIRGKLQTLSFETHRNTLHINIYHNVSHIRRVDKNPFSRSFSMSL